MPIITLVCCRNRSSRPRVHRCVCTHAVRLVNLNERNIINERFAESFLNDNSRDSWSEVKRLRSTMFCSSSLFDDVTTPDDIASVFAKKYQELYTSVDFDKAEIKAVRNGINVAVSSVGIPFKLQLFGLTCK